MPQCLWRRLHLLASPSPRPALRPNLCAAPPRFPPTPRDNPSLLSGDRCARGRHTRRQKVAWPDRQFGRRFNLAVPIEAVLQSAPQSLPGPSNIRQKSARHTRIAPQVRRRKQVADFCPPTQPSNLETVRRSPPCRSHTAPVKSWDSSDVLCMRFSTPLALRDFLHGISGVVPST